MTNRIVSVAHLYAAYRDFARSGKGGTALDRLKKLQNFGAIFKRLQQPYSIPRVNTFFERLETLDVITAWPFILALFDRLEGRPEILEAVLLDLESFLVRRMICRLSTRGYGDVFAALTSTVEGEPSQVPSAVRSALLAGTAETDRWPKDDELNKAWVRNPLYENITRPRLRMLLEAMEAGLRDDFAETTDVPKNLTIEHVMPQTWQEHWPLTEGIEATERDRILHTIGNLTLLNNKLNPYQSNRPWVDEEEPDEGKREILRAHSVLFLNKALCDLNDWNETRITARAETLFKLALKVWPRL